MARIYNFSSTSRLIPDLEFACRRPLLYPRPPFPSYAKRDNQPIRVSGPVHVFSQVPAISAPIDPEFRFGDYLCIRGRPMKQELFSQLDSLQSQFYDVEDTSDSASLISDETAATSLPLSPQRESKNHQHYPKKIDRVELARRAVLIQKGTQNLNDVLDCLEDMAVQESAQIEACLAQLADELANCVSMNTHRIAKKGLFPLKR